ncbi:hypothetical protein D3C81_1122830 [compost metagenome]
MQRRKLDGNPGAFVNTTTVGGLADGVNRLLIGCQVVLSIMLGQCSFTEHVVRIAKPFGFKLRSIRKRERNGFAGDKLLTHQAHGHVDTFANYRLPSFADNTTQRRGQTCLIVRRHQLASQHEPPGRSVYENRRAITDVLLPISIADLVAD